MNRITLKNDTFVSEINDSIKINEFQDLVKKYEIIINSSCDLIVIYEGDETKLNIEYLILDNVKTNIFEIRSINKAKVKYKYILKDNASMYLYRLNKAESIRESDTALLDGINSSINFNLRALTAKDDNYDILINHNNKNTKSILNNIGVSLKGSLIFNVTGSVPKGNTGSVLDQNNKIVTLDTTKCEINPNLLIDEYDVIANHNAEIGKFDEDILFYLMSRGISEENATKLMIEGLILSNLKENSLKEKILDIINEYWGVKK